MMQHVHHRQKMGHDYFGRHPGPDHPTKTTWAAASLQD